MHKEIRVVFNTSVFVPAVVKSLNPSFPDHENEFIAYNKFLEKGHYLVISQEIINEYCKVIAEEPFNFSPQIILVSRMLDLTCLGKLRNADTKLGSQIKVNVKIHNDDLHLLKAAIALDADFIVTEDGKLLAAADEVSKKHGVRIINAKTYATKYC